MFKKCMFYGFNTIVFVTIVILNLSCVSIPSRPASANTSGPRAIILNGEIFLENEVGGFISWFCYDFIDERTLRLEVGTFGDRKLEGLGYILFDGGYNGELTYYRRIGLEHRWDWGGRNDSDFAFVIKSDGTGLYYDFTNVRSGESTRARDVFKCRRR